MSVQSRQQAQSRADEIRAFQHELALLREEGVLMLDAGQGAAVAQHHEVLLAGLGADFDIDHDRRGKDLSRGMRAASLLGALAIAASVYYLYLQFWGRFNPAIQVGALVASAVGTFLGAMWLHGRDASGYFTKLAALVAFACFVLEVSLIGRIFDITPSDKAFLAWAALAFVLAYACDMRLLLVAGIACTIIFVSARVGSWTGMCWLDVWRWPENYFPSALPLFAVPLLVDHKRFDGFAATWRVSGVLCLLLPVLVLANWGESSRLQLDTNLIEGGYQVLGFALSGLAIWLGIRRRWPDTANTGVVLFVVFLYTKLFDWWWESMPKYLFFLVLGLVAVLVLSVLRRLRGRAMATGATP